MDATENLIPRIFTRNDPTVLRIFPPLAEEIGLNESAILLQLDFLISISNEGEKGAKTPIIRDGKAWTRQSLRELQGNWFPFWSPQTISRALAKLRDEYELIFVTDRYNKHDYDKSRWYALNPPGLGKLNSVTVHMVQLNGTGLFQIGTALSQDGTTIPETSSEIFEEDLQEVRQRDDYRDVFNAVMMVCRFKDPLSLGPGDYGEIDKLYAMQVTPEQIRQYYYGEQSWWFAVHWKGKKAQYPEPADIRRTIGQAIAFDEDGLEVPKPGRQRGRKKTGDADGYLRDNPPQEVEEGYRL